MAEIRSEPRDVTTVSEAAAQKLSLIGQYTWLVGAQWA